MSAPATYDADVNRAHTRWKMAILDAISVDLRTKAIHRQLAFRIGQYTNKHARVARVTIETLADDMGVERSTVRRAIKVLVDLGWLGVTQGRYRVPTQFRLLDANVAKVTNERLDRRLERQETKARIAASLPRSGAPHSAADLHRSGRPQSKPPSRSQCGRFAARIAADLPQQHVHHRLNRHPVRTLSGYGEGHAREPAHAHEAKRQPNPAPVYDRSAWDEQDWQVRLDEIAGQLEDGSGLTKAEAEARAADIVELERAWRTEVPLLRHPSGRPASTRDDEP